MTVPELITRLHIPAQTITAIQNIPMPENQAELKDSFFHKTSLFDRFAEADPTGLTVLKLYLHWVPDTKSRYDALGIPEECFWDSMQDLTIWCEDCITRYGTPGFREWGWVGCSLRLEIIRIGRLQYGPSRLSQNVTCRGNHFPANTPILDVHIPAGEALTPSAALASLNQAPNFYSRYFGKRFSLFHCHSWLLAPELKMLLPEQSRIIQFQNLFTIYRTDNEERQAEERVFGFLSDNPNDYPETTSLQKALKHHLLCGNEITMGAGIRTVS